MHCNHSIHHPKSIRSGRWRMSAKFKLMQSTALLLILLLACIGFCDAASPQAKLTRFANLPAKVAYVNDASVVFYHDSVKGDVWRSEDEGKTWQLVNGPPSGSAYILIEHPYDRNMVFILSNAKKHNKNQNINPSLK